MAVTTIVYLSITVGTCLFAEEKTTGEATATLATGALLTASGRVVLPDGSPAAGVTVRSMDRPEDATVTIRTNRAGEFRMRAAFEGGCRLHASSADGQQQTTITIPPVVARKVLSALIELKLQPAVSRKVIVLAGKRPASGVQVHAIGLDFLCQGITGRDGQVDLRIPAGTRLHQIAAWHPQLGACGKVNYPNGLADDPITLALHTANRSSPYQIRAVDPNGVGVPDLNLTVGIGLLEADWLSNLYFSGAQARTGKDGIALIPWMPNETLDFVTLELQTPDWKIDETDDSSLKKGITTVRVRRQTPILGRIIMPKGVSAEGILVEGGGWGVKTEGTMPSTRARRDGWFGLRVPVEHGFAVGVNDLEWASQQWTGKILKADGQDPARFTLRAYRATPVTVRVTHGANRQPLVDAWVDWRCQEEYEWTPEKGPKESGSGDLHSWFKTNKHGEFRTGVGNGKHRFRLQSGKWDEEKTIQISSDKPVVVEFHQN